MSAAGLVPVLGLAARVGLRASADEWLTVPTDKGAHAGSKVTALVAGMVAGADSIEDMEVLRHGGMGRLFSGVAAPSTLGAFLRAFAFGHVRQLVAVAARLVAGLAARTPVLPDAAQVAYLDVDDTVRATYGYAKQGAGTAQPASSAADRARASKFTDGSIPVTVKPRIASRMAWVP